MARSAEERLNPRWSRRSFRTPLQQGEEMLKEQQALDDKERLLRDIQLRGNSTDAFRSHIAANIRLRLKDAPAITDQALAINQQVMNIRKSLAGMLNARRELSNLKSRVQAVLEEEDPQEPEQPFLGLSLGFSLQLKPRPVEPADTAPE